MRFREISIVPFLGNEDGYLHDAFVSYAHADVEAIGNSPLKRWCQSFLEELRNEVVSELKQNQPESRLFDMFLDESNRPDAAVDPALPLSAQLLQAIHRSALLTRPIHRIEVDGAV